MKLFRYFILFAVILLVSSVASAQEATDTSGLERCATMTRLQKLFDQKPARRLLFEQQRDEFNRSFRETRYKLSERVDDNEKNIYAVPVVFHIVLPNPSIVTDAQIQAQLDTLNKAFGGTNGDTTKIPDWFKSLFGRSSIQFCLAQRTPAGEKTTGIERIVTTQSSFSSTTERVKHAAAGGADIWDGSKYFNVWIGILSGNILGYSTFPADGVPDEQGVVIDYRCLPGGSYTTYNAGKSLVHETGHYFNLYHIWGDDNGACSGTDYVEDTPNQGNSSTNCYSGVRTDNCTTGGNGIMYQNYMDYSPDGCLVMFTAEQVARMESALITYRSSLLASDGCEPVIGHAYNVKLVSIDQPAQRLCDPVFTPVVTIKNEGTVTLTSLHIGMQFDGGQPTGYNWTGSLAHGATASVALPVLTAATGMNTIYLYASDPNNHADEDPSNDTLAVSFQYYAPVTAVSESFEGATFPPAGWDIVNSDGSITWQRVSGVAKSGNASTVIDNYDYVATGERDYLRLPTVAIPAVDSAFLSFQVAAAGSVLLSDTLDVLVSTDCGGTYTSLYSKNGSALATQAMASANAFIPTATQWRKDSVDLSRYIDAGPVMIAFRNRNGGRNNVYLDDINIRTVTVNPNLKSQGFMVTPNPANRMVAIQFYPQPSALRSLQLFNMQGQKMAEIVTGGQPNNYYSFDISSYAAGTYAVRAVFTDKVLVKKIIKY